jgi:glycosyltransferase involved in cell wall biosynthesis
VLRELGFDVRTVAGEGPVDVVVEGLAIDDTVAPSTNEVRRALADADLVVVENICSLPLNVAASTAVAEAVAGKPAILHHHDLPWQRERFAGLRGFPPDDPAWAHVTTSALSSKELVEHRGFAVDVIRNAFDVNKVGGNRADARAALELDRDELMVVQPTRALARKNVPTGIALAEALGATYWLTGDAEEGYGPSLERLLGAARVRTIHGNPGLDTSDIYAAADAVVLPSTWEGFGNPAIESAIHRRPLAIGDYPVANELATFGFRWFSPADPDALGLFLSDPDQSLLDHNRAVARRHFSLDRLRIELRELLDRRGWLPS